VCQQNKKEQERHKGAASQSDTGSYELETIISSSLTARGKMEAILQFMYGGFFSKRVQLLYTLSNTVELRRTFLEKKRCMRDVLDELSAYITALLEEGKAAGDFDRTLPTPIMLSAFYGLLSPRSYERLIVEDQMPAVEAAKNLGRIYFKGITAN
jgi:hypothetical protein